MSQSYSSLYEGQSDKLKKKPTRENFLYLWVKKEIFNNYSSSPNGSESIAHEAEGLMGY